ncbi:MAG: glycosyltransferase, partial [Planctomycetia bacterium]
MRLAIIADTYPPLRMSGAVQMRDLVREFVDQGHDPVVIVPTSSQPEPWKIDTADGITVLRVRTPRTKDIDYVRRTINEMRLPYVLLRALRRSGLDRSGWDGIVWYAPTIFLGPIVRVLRRESRCRSYLILRDIFPEWAVDMGLMRRGLAYRFFKWIERGQYSVADTIGVQTPANMAYLEPWARETGRRLEVLQNWLSPAADAGCRIDLSTTCLAGRKVFVYAGNMGVAQGMDVFMELAVRMRERADVGFLFVGRGSDAARFAAMAQEGNLPNVLFHDEIEPKEIPGLLRQCHVGIVALDTRHKSHNIPGKFLTYMQAGIPVLARINPGNDLENLIRQEGVGRVCTGGDAATLQALAEDLLANPDDMTQARARGHALSDRLFSSSAAVRQIVQALRQPARQVSRSLRVLLVNQVFWPDVAATAQHGHDLARSLVGHGHQVTALASRSIYGESG